MTVPSDTIPPGYSPWPMARQVTTPFGVPGAQGLEEGVGQGQGIGTSPMQQFYGDNFAGSAPPSSVPQGGQQWTSYLGAGGAPSSLAQPPTPDIHQIIQSLMGPSE